MYVYIYIYTYIDEGAPAGSGVRGGSAQDLGRLRPGDNHNNVTTTTTTNNNNNDNNSSNDNNNNHRVRPGGSVGEVAGRLPLLLSSLLSIVLLLSLLSIVLLLSSFI